MKKIALDMNENADPHLVGYARVSTMEQNLDLQIEALVRYGVPKDKIWSEKKSASAKRRPRLEQCLKYLESGDTLVVWKLDRFGRSMQDLLGQVSSLEQRGISFVSITEQIETVTPGGKLMLHMLMALAQFERDLIMQRTRAGMERKRAEGWTPGPKRILTAAEETQIAKWKKSMTGREVVEMVKEKFDKKISPRTVALTCKRAQDRRSASLSTA